MFHTLAEISSAIRNTNAATPSVNEKNHFDPENVTRFVIREAVIIVGGIVGTLLLIYKAWLPKEHRENVKKHADRSSMSEYTNTKRERQFTQVVTPKNAEHSSNVSFGATAEWKGRQSSSTNSSTVVSISVIPAMPSASVQSKGYLEDVETERNIDIDVAIAARETRSAFDE